MTNPKEVLEHYRNEWETKIRKMEAGTELDVLIAEKVLGLSRCDYVTYGNEPEAFPHYGIDSNMECVIVHEIIENGGISSRGFLPSTDISAAWEVMDELNKTYDDVAVYSTNIGWGCTIAEFLPPNDEMEYNSNVYSHDAETAPLAICKAALLAVGG